SRNDLDFKIVNIQFFLFWNKVITNLLVKVFKLSFSSGEREKRKDVCNFVRDLADQPMTTFCFLKRKLIQVSGKGIHDGPINKAPQENKEGELKSYEGEC